MLGVQASYAILLWAIFLNVLMTACGQPSKRGPDNQLVQPLQLPHDSALAEAYFVEDVDCQRGNGSETVATSTIYQWQGRATAPILHQFDQVSSRSSLEGSVLRGTFYGLHQIESCRLNENSSLDCDGPAKVLRPRRPLKICHPDGHFSRASVEGIGLTSLATLDAAYSYYEGVFPNANKMQRASLLILPTVEKVYEERASEGLVTRRRVETDNLAYIPNYAGSAAFVVFPKGRCESSTCRWKDLNLWEWPWGLKHEFGHHVFQTHTDISNVSSVHSHPDSAWRQALPIHSFDKGSLTFLQKTDSEKCTMGICPKKEESNGREVKEI